MYDIKKQLEDDEEILWKGMTEKSPYVIGAFSDLRGFLVYTIFTSVIFGFIVFADSVDNSGSGSRMAGLLSFYLFMMSPVIYSLIKTIFFVNKAYNQIYYVITNRRLLLRNGINKIYYSSVYFKDIVDCHMYVSLSDRNAQTATIEVSQYGRYMSTNHLFNISDYAKVLKLINENIRNAKAEAISAKKNTMAIS